MRLFHELVLSFRGGDQWRIIAELVKQARPYDKHVFAGQTDLGVLGTSPPTESLTPFTTPTIHGLKLDTEMCIGYYYLLKTSPILYKGDLFIIHTLLRSSNV